MHKPLFSLTALLVTAVLSGCSSTPETLSPGAPAAEVQTPPLGSEARAATLGITSSARQLSLRHWSSGALPVVLDPRKKVRGPVSLRLERADGQPGDTIEVTPSSVTLDGRGPTAVTLRVRPTRVAFPAEDGAQPWRLVASQGGRELGRLTLSVALSYVNFKFRVQPFTAREGQTVNAVLTVDADSREVPPFTFGLSQYIPDEISQYELVEDPQRPTQYRVNKLPATFQVPIRLNLFPGAEPAVSSATFQLSVEGLSALGSERYAPRFVRADLNWTLAR